MGRPLGLWVAFGDRATVFGQHCNLMLSPGNDYVIFVPSISLVYPSSTTEFISNKEIHGYFRCLWPFHGNFAHYPTTKNSMNEIILVTAGL